MNDLRIVGVDLAAAPSRTGVVILDVTKGQARATLPPDGFVADDNGLVALVTIGTVIGVDAHSVGQTNLSTQLFSTVAARLGHSPKDYRMMTRASYFDDVRPTVSL